jgi:hypothetical protein
MIMLPIEEIQGKPHDEIFRFEKLTHESKLEDALAGGWPLTTHAQLYVEGDLKRKDSSTIPSGSLMRPCSPRTAS